MPAILPEMQVEYTVSGVNWKDGQKDDKIRTLTQPSTSHQACPVRSIGTMTCPDKAVARSVDLLPTQMVVLSLASVSVLTVISSRVTVLAFARSDISQRTTLPIKIQVKIVSRLLPHLALKIKKSALMEIVLTRLSRVKNARDSALDLLVPWSQAPVFASVIRSLMLTKFVTLFAANRCPIRLWAPTVS